MNTPLFLGLLIFLSVIYVWIGFRASKKIDGTDDYFLGKRSIGLIPLIMTILATQLGGGTILGAAEEAYSKGWTVVFYPMGMCLGLVMLALGLGSKLRSLEISTISELFEKVYGSKLMRKFSSLLSIISLFFILVAQGIAARKFFCYLGQENPWLFMGFWMVIILYTVSGGLKAVVSTDILQVLFILISFALVLGSYFFGSTPSFENTAAPVIATNGFQIPWIGWLLMPFLFMLIEQDMGQRCFAAKTTKTVSIATGISALVCMLICLIPIFFGVLAAKAGLEPIAGSSILLRSVEAFTSPNVTTVFALAVLMAILSTADSLLCSVSSNVSLDFILKKGPQKNIRISQLVTFIIGMLTMGVCYLFDNVVGMLMFSYELSVSMLFVPVLMAIIVKNPTKQAAIASMVMGALGFICWNWLSIPLPREVGVLALSLAGFIMTQLLIISKRKAALEI